MKKFIIIPANTDLNRGDQALVWETINIFKEIEEKSEYYVLESGNTSEEILLQSRQTWKKGIKTCSPVLLHPGRNSSMISINYSKGNILFWGWRAIQDFFITSLLLTKSEKINTLGKLFMNKRQLETLKLFNEADGVILKGGGIFHFYGKITEIYLSYYLLYHIMLAKRFNKKIYILPNSYGPLKNKIVNKILKNTLSKVEFISSREEISYNCLKDKLKIENYLFPDLGFFVKPSSRDFRNYLLEKGLPLDTKKIVCITLRPYRFPESKDPDKKYKKYISEIIKVIDFLSEKEYHILFMAHTLGPSAHEDDRIAIKEVLKFIEKQKKMSNITYIEDASLNCEDLVRIYSYMNFIIGTRFHSVIFALNSNIPAIAISYGGNKGVGIMKDIGIENLSISIEEIEESKLKNKIEYIENNYLLIQKRIVRYREKIQNEREKLKNLLRSII